MPCAKSCYDNQSDQHATTPIIGFPYSHFNLGNVSVSVRDNYNKIIIERARFCDKDRRNTFIETVLKHSLLIIANRIPSQKFDELVLKGLNIYMAGSNDFYSQREQLKNLNLPLTTTSLRALTPFCKVHTLLKQVHKTGLGSSAALTTSLVAALFVYFECVDKVNDDVKERTLIHNVSQFCHCLAQGKVGSGFDISAAIWGKFKMVLAEVDSGSNTPSMVGKVLAWRKENSEQVRQLLRDMSNMSDAPIEPPMQTRLLDACTEVPGVIMAGVPGGIGDNFITQVETVWENWNEMSVGPLLTRESSDGFMKENLEN
ncbi:9362_t:CDS:2, partial [Racocetra fulgida]